MKKIYCLRQIFRPSGINVNRKFGEGNCLECAHDPDNNKKCIKFYPVHLDEYEVAEK